MSARLLNNSILGSLAGLCPLVASFVSSVIIARTLGVDAIGVIAFSTWVVATAVIVANLGIPVSLTRFLPELVVQSQQGEAIALVSALFKLFVIATAFGAIILLTLTTWVTTTSGTITNSLTWTLTAVWFVIQAFNYFYFDYLRGKQSFQRAARIAVISAILQIFSVAIGSWTFQIPGALLGYIVGSSIAALLCIPLWKSAGSLPSSLRKRVATNAAYLWLYNVLSLFVWARIELFFLALYFDSEIVGLFSIGLSLSALAGQLPAFFALGLLPFFTEQYATGQLDSLRSNYATAIRIMALIAFPVSFGLAAVAEVGVPLIYGSPFSTAVPSVMVLVAGAATAPLSTVGSAVIYGMERNRFFLVSSAVGAGIMIVIGVTVIPWFGMMGAALARVTMQTFLVGLFMWYMASRLDCPTPLKDLARIVASASLCAIVAYGLVQSIRGPHSLLAAIPVGALVYFFSIRAFGALPKGDIEKLQRAFEGMAAPISRPAIFVLRLLA